MKSNGEGNNENRILDFRLSLGDFIFFNPEQTRLIPPPPLIYIMQPLKSRNTERRLKSTKSDYISWGYSACYNVTHIQV